MIIDIGMPCHIGCLDTSSIDMGSHQSVSMDTNRIEATSMQPVSAQIHNPITNQYAKRVRKKKTQASNLLHLGHKHYLFCLFPCLCHARQPSLSFSGRYSHSTSPSFSGPCWTIEPVHVSLKQHALTHCQVCPNHGQYLESSFPTHSGAMPSNGQSYE